MADDVKLKPCPFCGSEDIVEKDAVVTCNRCFATAGGNEVWNSRPAPVGSEPVILLKASDKNSLPALVMWASQVVKQLIDQSRSAEDIVLLRTALSTAYEMTAWCRVRNIPLIEDADGMIARMERVIMECAALLDACDLFGDVLTIRKLRENVERPLTEMPAGATVNLEGDDDE